MDPPDRKPTTQASMAQAAAIASALRSQRSEQARTWSHELSEWTLDVTSAVCAAVGPAEGMRILDLASGLGDPAIDLCKLIGNDGSVVALDKASDSLHVAARRSAARGLRSISFVVADSGLLPVRSMSLDLVTYQLGMALVDDPVPTLHEIKRVLSRSGRVVIANWAASASSAVYTSTIGVVASHVGERRPSPDERDPYRFGRPGSTTTALRSSGFVVLREDTVPVIQTWKGTVETFWVMVRQRNPTIDRAISAMTTTARRQVADDVAMALRAYQVNDTLCLPVNLNVTVATKA